MTPDPREALRALAAIATPRPWIREWESLRVRSAFGDGDVLLRQHNIDLAVAAVHYVDDVLAQAAPPPDRHEHDFITTRMDGVIVDKRCSCGMTPLDWLGEQPLAAPPSGLDVDTVVKRLRNEDYFGWTGLPEYGIAYTAAIRDVIAFLTQDGS